MKQKLMFTFPGNASDGQQRCCSNGTGLVEPFLESVVATRAFNQTDNESNEDLFTFIQLNVFF